VPGLTARGLSQARVDPFYVVYDIVLSAMTHKFEQLYHRHSISGWAYEQARRRAPRCAAGPRRLAR
jgi:hypothetical protein